MKRSAEIADREADKNLLQYQEHLDKCPNCRYEIVLQRSIRIAARQVPLADPAPMFNTRIMSIILPVKKWGIREHVFHAVGYFITGAWILAFFGILFYTFQSGITFSSEPAAVQQLSKFLKIFSGASDQISHTLMRIVLFRSSDVSVLKFSALILLALVILIFVDKLLGSLFTVGQKQYAGEK